MKHRLQVVLISCIVALMRLLPLSVVRVLGRAIGHVVWRSMVRSVRITRLNIRLCMPELTRQEQDRLAYESTLEMCVTGLEMFWVWSRPPEDVFDYVYKVQGLEAYQEALDAGKGLFIAAPHLGNWEVVGLYCAKHAGMASMYAPIRNAVVDNLVKNSRSQTGASLVPTDVRGVRALLKALKQGQQVGILPDQRAQTGSGVFSPFFGQIAYTMTLLPALKRKVESPVFACFAERVKQGWVMHIELVPDTMISGDEQQAVDGLNKAVESLVREAPAQYQWEYKRFSTQPDGTDPYDIIRKDWPKSLDA